MSGKVDRIIFVLYAASVAFASLRPGNGASIEPWDKLLHLLVYGFFALLAYRLGKEPRQYLYLCIGIVFFSGLLEVAQSFMPGRVMSALDLLANLLGVVLGAIIAKQVFRKNYSD